MTRLDSDQCKCVIRGVQVWRGSCPIHGLSWCRERAAGTDQGEPAERRLWMIDLNDVRVIDPDGNALKVYSTVGTRDGPLTVHLGQAALDEAQAKRPCGQPACDRTEPCDAERSGWCAHPDAGDGLASRERQADE